MSTLLIIDDDKASCRMLQMHFRSQGHNISLAHSVDEGLNYGDTLSPEVIILDIRMPGRSGLEGLPDIKTTFPNSRIIMITAFHDMSSTIQAMKEGADDYIHKPIDLPELDQAVAKALISHYGSDDDIKIKSSPFTDSVQNTMVGSSPAMRDIFKTIGRVAQSPASVLITGESGTGKELVARAIHLSSERASGPFIAINCAALVETLLESDMFGHEKGSFTGAVNKQTGKFSLANDGTIFLDEVGELSLSMQAKLLRVLQEKEFIPVGGKVTHTTNARVIAATNIDFNEHVKNGHFREDLFYRLQVVNIHIPPLRERKEDIFDLTQSLLGRANKEMNKNVNRVSVDVMQALQHYKWPGNVRELENVLIKSVAMSSRDIITADLLPDKILHSVSAEIPDEDCPKDLSTLSLQEIEKLHIQRVLESTNGHKGKTCEILGVSRPRLRRLIKQYNLSDDGNSFHEINDDKSNDDKSNEQEVQNDN
ncbi:MAG: sigma-54 dependent transcriptional regulator [gamma proteobacterium symbiont of Bathyaustriella thionipta]|nr:sigma-54 dependent transcriptional regulator [gamma proteobacterium symbiont of Bathyaustriella thionipta]